MAKRKTLKELVDELETMDGSELLEFIKENPIDTLSVISYYQGWIKGAKHGWGD